MAGSKNDKMENGGAYVLEGLYMLAIVAAPVLLIGIDLSLGPQFMTAYVEQTGLYNGLLATIIPWALSIATTGFQYLLIRGIRDNGFWKGDLETKLGIIVGLAVLVFDTATDLAGTASWLYGPEAGMQVIPDHTDARWTILAPMTIIVCALNEFMLDPALKWITKKHIPFTDMPHRRQIFTLAMNVRRVYRDFKFLAQTFAVGSIAILDISLIIYFFVTTVEASGDTGYAKGAGIVGFFIGLLVFTLRILLYLMWRSKHRLKVAKRKQAREDRKSRAEMVMQASMDDETPKKKKPKTPFAEWISTPLLAGFAILGIGLSIGGFTLLMYGPGDSLTIFPEHPSLAWKLLALVIGTLCGFFLPFTEMGYGRGRKSFDIDLEADEQAGMDELERQEATVAQAATPSFPTSPMGGGFGMGGGFSPPGNGSGSAPGGFDSWSSSPPNKISGTLDD